MTARSTKHTDELARLQAVARYNVLDTPRDGSFDRITRLASRWFGTPMASVTIVDIDRIWFKAATGLGELTEIARHDGLCASVVASGERSFVADASGPLSYGGKKIGFYAGAPIVTADGFRLGTVNVMDTAPRETTDDDLEILVDLAAIAMDELEMRLSALAIVHSERALRQAAERDTATITDYAAVLQRTLLPPQLPAIPGLGLASHYHAASDLQVGGDFYDVFATGPDSWAFFLGDVQGHGAGAAAVTSLIRYTLRAAALHHDDLTDGLNELNTVLTMDPEQKRFCTVLFGSIRPDAAGDGFLVTLATGGHPPALLVDSGTGSVHEIRSSTGMFVGALENATFSACSFRLRPGQTLLMYTDGITEARPNGEKMFGEEGLHRFVAERSDVPAGDLVLALARLVPSLSPIDDIALVALSVPSADGDGRPTVTVGAITPAA